MQPTEATEGKQDSQVPSVKMPEVDLPDPEPGERSFSPCLWRESL